MQPKPADIKKCESSCPITRAPATRKRLLERRVRADAQFARRVPQKRSRSVLSMYKHTSKFVEVRRCANVELHPTTVCAPLTTLVHWLGRNPSRSVPTGRTCRSTELLSWPSWSTQRVGSRFSSSGARSDRFARSCLHALPYALMPLLRAPLESAPCLADSSSRSGRSAHVQRRVLEHWSSSRATSGGVGSSPRARVFQSHFRRV